MPTENFTVEVPTHAIRLAVAELHATPQQAGRAFGKALRDGVRSARTVLVKQVAAESGLTQRAIRPRIVSRVYKDRESQVGRIFVGLNPVPLAATLSPGQLRSRYERRRPVRHQGEVFRRSFYQKPKRRAGNKQPYVALQRRGNRSYPTRPLGQNLYSENIGRLRGEETRIADLVHRRFSWHLRGELGR